MKKLLFPLLGILTLAAGCNSGRDQVQEQLDAYANIPVGSSFFEGISDNGREVLNYFKLASDEVDNIYWKQNFGDKNLMASLPTNAQRVFATVNYGPWNRIDGQAFVEGYGERPLGAAFYPEDMTAEEFAAFDDPAKNSPYTMIRRDADGKLKAEWYHDAFKHEIGKIVDYLRTAANYTIKQSVRDYLLAKIDALQTDDYYNSDMLWLSMDDSKMDLIIGPQENEDDRLYGIKASYESYVLLKNLNLTSEISGFTGMIPALQEALPCDPAYKTFVPGAGSTIYAYDVVYCSGNANAGIKKIAVNLPYDLNVQAEKGTRTAILSNVIDAKYSKIILPAGRLLLAREQSIYLDNKAFFWNTALREVAHGLGVKQTVNGKGTVSEALGDEALTIEEIKGDVLGLFLNLKLIADRQMDPLMSREDAVTTFVIANIRSSRFGEAEALGLSNLIIYNWMKEKQAFTIDRSGHYLINFDNSEEAVRDLASRILTIQATGDKAAASSLIKKYGTTSESLRLDFAALQRAHVPMDIRFQFGW